MGSAPPAGMVNAESQVNATDISLTTDCSKADSVNNASDIDRSEKWRKDGYDRWDDKVLSELREDIDKCVDGLPSQQEIEIIVCGGTGQGKSSVINNCMAALTGIHANIADHGAGDSQLTTRYRRFLTWTHKDGKTRKLPLMFSDTRGFSESRVLGAPLAAIKSCILGKVLPDEPIDTKQSDEWWGNRKTLKCKASYIFLVADANAVPDDGDLASVRSQEILYKILREIREFSVTEGINVAAFLTMCDKLDPETRRAVSHLHYSKPVETKVKAFSKMMNIPENRIFPIINYTSEIRVTNEMAI